MLRSSILLLLIVGGAALIAQIAGVTGVRQSPTVLQLGENSQQWLVQFPEDASAKEATTALDAAAEDLTDGGTVGSELPGGWHEVQLADDVSAADAEQAFIDQGATNVEAVVPRVAYDLNQPGSASDPAPGGTSAPTPRSAGSDQPDAVDDPPSAFTSGGTFHDRLVRGTMNATRLREQWSLDQDSDIDIDGTEAWQAATGNGVTVATIDTGADASHPDLRGRVLDGMDFSRSNTGATHDGVGHGTHVASIIAGGGVTMAGVAPDAKILPLKVFRDSEAGFSMDGYIQAIKYAVDNGVKVINISLGCGGTAACYSQAEYDAIKYANDHGVLVVAAAGNGDAAGRGMNNDAASTPDYPSDYDLPNIVSVTATTKLGTWSTWANYGVRNVDLAAPGESILAASPGTGYTSVTGTSFSAPIVSGALALLASSDPKASADDLKARLLAGVDRLPDLKSRTVSGGTLNANTALRAAPVVADADVTALQQVAPTNRASVKVPPTMTWRMPTGWRALRVELRGGGSTYTVTVDASRRALAQPVAAWRAGTYTWRVLAANAAGSTVATPWRTYTLQPRVAARVTSGRLARGGRTMSLRVNYAAMGGTAAAKIRIVSGGHALHNGRSTSHREHVRGSGTPRHGSFVYSAKLAKRVRSGSVVTIYVTIASGGASHTYRFTAHVK